MRKQIAKRDEKNFSPMLLAGGVGGGTPPMLSKWIFKLVCRLWSWLEVAVAVPWANGLGLPRHWPWHFGAYLNELSDFSSAKLATRAANSFPSPSLVRLHRFSFPFEFLFEHFKLHLASIYCGRTATSCLHTGNQNFNSPSMFKRRRAESCVESDADL